MKQATPTQKRVILWQWAAIGVLASYLVYQAVKPPMWNPYDRVQVIRAEVVGGELFFAANFRKIECELDVFRPVGITLGEVVPLKWEDMHGREPDDNREAGRNTLRVKILLPPTRPELVEIRTRHACPTKAANLELVNRVFATVPLTAE